VRGSDGLPLFAIGLPLSTAVQVALIATVCGVLAAIAPARQTATDPAQAIGSDAMNPAKASHALIELRDVRKTGGLPSEAEVLHGLSLRVDRGEFVALIGPSGSGKSTLLNIVGLLERMTSGSYRLQDEEMQGLGDTELTMRRRTRLGVVFQFHHLLPADAPHDAELGVSVVVVTHDRAWQRAACQRT
jgi:ABC-type transport system involved in cytochrome bd biosynthesis fused ATPase/permease subunit